MKFQKRFSYVGDEFVNLYACEDGIFVFGCGEPMSPEQIQEVIKDQDKRRKDAVVKIKALKKSVEIYKKEFSKQ